MNPTDPVYPFTAVVGQELLKRALLLNAVCPALGGVLIAGERGTAKSTAARALAALLPRLSVVRACPYHCNPAAMWLDCPNCRGEANHEVANIAAPFVELPLGATEDRVAGSLDIERTLREGRPVFHPGLLAAAHRGVLYIDEINLLPDHIADLLLDAAASGFHVVQREGISVRHPARFILVGTMNPEEGELRPQLADRFGLKVNVSALTEPAERAEVVRRRLAYEADPVEFNAAWLGEQRQLAEQLVAARDMFAAVALGNEQLDRIAAVCLDHHVEGLRADLALGRAARALATFAGRTQVVATDLQAAAELVLPHRTRRGRPPRPVPDALPELFENNHDANGHDADGEQNQGEQPACGEERVHTPGAPAPAPKIGLGKAQLAATGDRGRRQALLQSERGRPIGAARDASARDVALGATLRAAAQRGGTNGQLAIRPEHLHRHVREDRRGSLIVFVVDASGSMGARRRMEAVKGVALGLLKDAGRMRDEVAVIAVRGARAECLLLPTRAVAVAEQALTRLPTGGRTPLAHGLTLARELAVHDASRPALLILVSDGKANVPLPGTDGDPWAQTLAACAGVVQANIKAMVIDADEGHVKTGRVPELAAALATECVPLASVSADLVGRAVRDQSPAAASE